MAKLTRYLQKIFAKNSNQVGVFGTGTDKETSKNVETLQSADYEDGWSSAIITNKNYPIWQERDGVDYGFSYQLAYLMQQGMPEWLSTETYYTNSFCRYGAKIYYSLQDNNTNHNPALNNGYWTEFSSVPEDRLHALKSYEDAGELLTDTEGLTDVTAYSHSTFDLSKFTVTGSPTITSDGVVSGFSISKYVATSSIDFASASNWVLEFQFNIGNGSTSNEDGLFSTAGYGIQFKVGTGNVLRGAFGDGSSFFYTPSNLATLSTNTDYTLKIVFSGTAYTGYLNGSQIFTGSYSTKIPSGAIRFGVDRSANYSLTNLTVDLKKVLIKANGVPIFSGNISGSDTYTIGGSTITIPYRLSKTGSKIVDSAYRTQVASVYNAQGYAPYYTLSDTDFTLPQGEIYGLMVQAIKNNTYIVETYQNNADGYMVLSDKTCIQWIRSTRTGNETTVTLLKNYANTNYVRVMSDVIDSGQAGYSSHVLATNITASSFTYYQTHAFIGTTDWITIGKIA